MEAADHRGRSVAGSHMRRPRGRAPNEIQSSRSAVESRHGVAQRQMGLKERREVPTAADGREVKGRDVGEISQARSGSSPSTGAVTAGVAPGLRETWFSILSVESTRWRRPETGAGLSLPPSSSAPVVSCEISPIGHAFLASAGIAVCALLIRDGSISERMGVTNWSRPGLIFAGAVAYVVVMAFAIVRPNPFPKPASTAFAALPIVTHSPSHASSLSRLGSVLRVFVCVTWLFRFRFMEDGAKQHARSSFGG